MFFCALITSHNMHLFPIIAFVLNGPLLSVAVESQNSQTPPGDLNSVMQSWYNKIQQTTDDKAESLLQQMKTYTHKILNIDGECESTSDVCGCSDVKAMGITISGVYRLYVVIDQKRYYADAYCDMDTTSGDWTVFQRRKDGSIDFYRNWRQYANGFGDPNGEFWLGNEFLYVLTTKRNFRLRVDLKDWNGNKAYAEYSFFNLSSAADKYRLTIGSYSGDAGDSLSFHNSQQFTTQDSDNDMMSGVNCAVQHHGAWWYNNCYYSNLNGYHYLRGSEYNDNYNGIIWHQWLGFSYSLKATEMKISPVA